MLLEKCKRLLILIEVVIKAMIQECINSNMQALESAKLKGVVKATMLESINSVKDYDS